MKKTILSMMAVIAVSISVNAQVADSKSSSESTYKMALGGRFGYALAPSFKTFISEKGAIEAIAFFRPDWLQTNIIYQVHNQIKGAEGLAWYYGGGAAIFIYNSKFGGGSDFAAVGNIGIDFKFKDIPLNLSLDYQPYFSFNSFYGFVGDSWGGLAVRYVLK